MGKKKQAQRTKNNAVPASSGRSAELLQSTSGVPYIGFTTLKEGGYIPILSGLSDELDVNINEDFRLVWKKMNKKDKTTKLKALDEFKRLCQTCDVETLKPVLPFWPRLYCTLSTDEENRVREASHNAHRALVAKAGRNIAPYLKQLVGPWFTGQHDTYAPAASAAQAAFQETFPPNKLIEAIVFCQEEILSYICDNLLNQSPATNQEEGKDARYERVIVSCLNGYALYLMKLPTEHLRKAEERNLKLITSAKFWKFNKDSTPIVRAAWFTALVALCEKAAFLLRDESKHVCMAVFTNLDECEPSVVQSLWQAVLLTFSVFDDVWKHVSLEKLVLPKLWKVLRDGADGSASLVFPNLLPLLSKIPSSLLTDKAKFYSKYFDNLQAGLSVRNVQMSSTESNAVVTAYFESISYIISNNSDNHELCLSLVENQMFSLVEAVLLDAKLHLARSCVFSALSRQLNHWSRHDNSSLTDSFWTWIDAKCQTLLEEYLSDPDTLASNCTTIQALVITLKTPNSQRKKSLKVKFVSPSNSTVSSDELSPVDEPCSVEFAPAFVMQFNQYVDKQLRLCFRLMEHCGQQSKAILVGHISTIVEEYNSTATYSQVVNDGGGSWKVFYQQYLSQWLKNDNIPFHPSLKLTFTLLQHVAADSDVQLTFNDLSKDRWQSVVEWALKPHNQSAAACQWLQSHGEVCRLVSLLTRHHTSYNTLHNTLRNLRHNSWLSSAVLSELVNTLRHNLTHSSVAEDVKACSSDLLQAMLHNVANHSLLAQLSTQDLQGLLYELFTATLQHLPHFPEGWQHCVSVLALQPEAHLDSVCRKCVDLLVAVVRTGSMTLGDMKHVVSVLEQLMLAAATEDSLLDVVLEVVGHLASRAAEVAPAVWSLLSVAHYLSGSVRQLALSQHRACLCDDPLSSIPLQQYVDSMIPLVVVVKRLLTAEEGLLLPYPQLHTDVPAEDLMDWSLQVLHLHSLCDTVKQHFVNTKQYFILREKLSFILEECRLLDTLRLGEVIKHLNRSVFEEGTSSLRVHDSLSTLQTQVILRHLGLFYGFHKVQKELLHLKPRNLFVQSNCFPEEVLEEVAAVSGLLEKSQLPTINTCCFSCFHETHTPISILDRVFDQFVAEEKENRSLLGLSLDELDHITQVADFVYHSVHQDCVHLQQSSWDACLVATAALALSVATTLSDLSQPAPATQVLTSTHHTAQPWPLSLLAETTHQGHQQQVQDPLSLALVRVVCSVCRLFDAVSAYMNSVDPEDKAALTRRTEWTDVFLPGTHAAMTRAWISVAELPCEWPSQFIMLEALSQSVAQYVQYPHFVLDNNILNSLDSCCKQLQSNYTSVQLAAYQLFLKLIPAMIDLDIQESEKDNVALSCSHVQLALEHTQCIVELILSELKFGDLCIVEPFTDSYRFARSYMLLWCALFELCGKASFQLRALYTTWLKVEHLPVLMKAVFCLMPEAARTEEVSSQRVSQLFAKAPQFNEAVWDSQCLAHLSCWVFGRSLRYLPAAIRQWLSDTDSRTRGLVEHVTTSYVSKEICAEELRSIQSQDKKLENMTVQVNLTTKDVYAVYTFEDSSMDLLIELAHNHPLGLVKVKSGQRMVSTTQTRTWLIQISILLTHQNGSIWDALELWKHNLDKKVEGVEECYICFAVLIYIHGTHQLPKMSCQTCRKKFHSCCLFKWFETSNKGTCPICRTFMHLRQ